MHALLPQRVPAQAVNGCQRLSRSLSSAYGVIGSFVLSAREGFRREKRDHWLRLAGMISARRAPRRLRGRGRWIPYQCVRLGVGAGRGDPIQGGGVPLAGSTAPALTAGDIHVAAGKAGCVAAGRAAGGALGGPPSGDRVGHVSAAGAVIVFFERRLRARLQHSNLNREIGQTLQPGVLVATSWIRHSGRNTGSRAAESSYVARCVQHCMNLHRTTRGRSSIPR